MSGAGFSRNEALWGIAFSVGLKHLAAIACRVSGENLVEKKYKSLLLERLAEVSAGEK